MRIDTDPVVSEIATLSRVGQMPSYKWLKGNFGASQVSDSVYQSLNRGRAILQTVDQLNQYLFSYAPMVAYQWEHGCKALVARPSEHCCRLIDYGCGQGLAGLLLNDFLGPEFLSDAATIIAVEPSLVALRRATAVYQALVPCTTVYPVNKGFDQLQSSDFGGGNGPTSHVFSNVLDIDGYDHVALLRKALSPGLHTIIAIGHDRTVHGYSQGMLRVKDAVENGSIHPKAKVQASDMEKFECGPRGVPAVLWLAKLEVSDE